MFHCTIELSQFCRLTSCTRKCPNSATVKSSVRNPAKRRVFAFLRVRISQTGADRGQAPEPAGGPRLLARSPRQIKQCDPLGRGTGTYSCLLRRHLAARRPAGIVVRRPGIGCVRQLPEP
ncbi:hypothetical protein XFF6970_290044 [Xanthomonas citri pv. fuscans]|nr:hypothetical protein XFF6970_290044 [Xanthomonas citri pv. fuscans]